MWSLETTGREIDCGHERFVIDTKSYSKEAIIITTIFINNIHDDLEEDEESLACPHLLPYW